MSTWAQASNLSMPNHWVQSYLYMSSQSRSIFRKSDSGRFLFNKQEELLSHHNQTDVYLDIYITD